MGPASSLTEPNLSVTESKSDQCGSTHALDKIITVNTESSLDEHRNRTEVEKSMSPSLPSSAKLDFVFDRTEKKSSKSTHLSIETNKKGLK